MSTNVLKTLQRTVLATLLVAAVAACSSLPQPQVAKADLAAQNAVFDGE